jgi:VWFA-related protein
MSFTHRLRSLVSAGCLVVALPLPAQTGDSDKPKLVRAPAKDDSGTATISAQVKLVNLPVVVRDKKGAIVQGIPQTDFKLQVDRHDQTIRYFDLDNDLPLTLGLLVDTSGSVSSALNDERSASSAFLDKMLTPGRDKAFVLQFAAQSELLQDVTGSLPKLQAALKDLGPTAETQRSPDPDDTADDNSSNGGKNGNNNSGRRPRRGGSALYDAAFLAADELMAKQTGRKALILLTDGEDRSSKESIAKAIEAAQRADTTIYAIYFKGQEERSQNNQQQNPGQRRGGGGGYPGIGFPGGGGNGGGNHPTSAPSQSHIDGKAILERMAGETGGRVFEESKKHTFDAIFTEIAEELRSRYRLGFTPSADQAASGYHEVDLTLPDKKYKGFIIQTRDGYYTGK